MGAVVGSDGEGQGGSEEDRGEKEDKHAVQGQA